MPIVTGLNANVFRAVSGSLFSSPVNWSRGVVPTGSDVAIVSDNCVIDISRTIGSLVVRSGFTASINTGLTLQVNDVIDVMGHLSCSGAPTVNVLSSKNKINSLSAGSSTFNFLRDGNQNVPGLVYNNLSVFNAGTKKLIGDTTINGNLNFGNNSIGQLDLVSYNFVVNGATIFNVPLLSTIPALIKTGPGNVTFVGVITTGALAASLIDFSGGNPNVEVRGGFNFWRQNSVNTFKSGTGTWSFTTNNQSLTDNAGGGIVYFDGPIVIASGITLTINSGFNLAPNATINGASGTSSLINKGTITYATLRSISSMSVGIFDYTTFTNTIHYTLTNNITLPFTTYHNLIIQNGGTKTASGNTTILGNLDINSFSPVFQLASFNLQVNGFTQIGNGSINKSGPGNVLFIGAVVNGSVNTPFIDFSGGNPNVEVRGGINMYRAGSTNFKSGTGTWTFSTNNQSIIDTADAGTETFFGPVIISGAITLTIGSSNSSSMTIIFDQGINGNNAASTLLIGPNRVTAPVIINNAATQPMATGILDTSTNLNTFIYGSGSQNIKGGTYRNLTLNGGGTKTLQGNVSVQNTYTLTAPATLNNNGFTLTNP
jgi:hypothetical protein